MSKAKAVPGQKYGKGAFLNAAKNTNDRLVLQVLLEDDVSYTKEEAAKLVEAWKKKEVEA